MALRSDGSWAAKRVGDFGGRQGAGKSATVIARIFGGVFLVGEQLTIYTAHEYPTANEIFIRIGQLFEAWDDLSRLVISEKRAHGDQGYELKGPPGSEITGKRRILFKTRTGKSGRGFAKADLLIYDEAQHLLREQIAGSGPAKLANPNSQSWWSGSGGLALSAPAWEMREQAVTGVGAGRLSYTEHTAETWQVTPNGVVWSRPDPDDREGWYRANPGLGRWVAEEDMADLKLELGELFERECLCVWESLPSVHGPPPKLPADAWASTVVYSPVPINPGEIVLSFDVSPGGEWSSIAIAAGSLDAPYVEVIEHQAGTGWLPGRLVELVQRWQPMSLVCDSGGPAGSVVGAVVHALRLAGVSSDLLHQTTFGEMKQACGAFYADVVEGRLRRPPNQGPLDNAAADAAERRLGESWAWDRRSATVPISPLVAVTLARSLLGDKPPKLTHSASAFVSLDDY
jgi:hypothetical protein